MAPPGWRCGASARGLRSAGSFGLFGTLLLGATLLRRHRLPELKYLAWASLAVALLAGLGWFLLQAEDFSEAQTMSDFVASLPIVAWDTRFGAVLIGRCAALAVAALCYQLGARAACCAAGRRGGCRRKPGSPMAVRWKAGSARCCWRRPILHILAGAVLAWDTAGSVSGDPAPGEPDGAALAKNYSPLGIACVVALLATGFIEYLVLIGQLGALVRTAYGVTALVKMIALRFSSRSPR